MVGSAIHTLTTYEPFGNLLAQTGTSGTVYGFAGEQQDSATGLLYLRARYYNPGLHSFMVKDPWDGNGKHPLTFNGYVYGYNSPPNFTDPSGYDPIWCAAEAYETTSVECSPYNLLEFGGAATEEWTDAEKWELNGAAAHIARRLAAVYNEYMAGIRLPDYLYDMYYGFCRSDKRPLSPREAFLYSYGRPVLFYKTGIVNDWLSYGNYGTTPAGRVGINVYLYPADTDAYLDDPESYDTANLAYRFTSENAGYHWATHELGHYFEARVNGIMGNGYVRSVLGADKAIPLRGGDNDERSYGFAGTRYGWQQSPEATRGEEFADMYLGWNYNQWAPPLDREFHIVGQARASFMDRHMAAWIALVINRERNGQ